MSGNIGLPTITYGAEGEGRPSTVSASSGQNPVTAANYYNLYQSPYQLSVTFGSGDSDVFTFDPNTFRLNKYQFNVGSQAVTGTLGWNANWSLGSLGISDPFSAANTQTCSFTADDLSRISQTNCGTIWAQTFSYDPFGNIQTHQTAGSGTSFAPTYASSPITNRISTVGGTSATYDANGNSLYDTFRTFSWDADSNPITIGSVTLTYDAFDRMVEQSVASTHSEIVYGPAGVKLALMNGTTLTKAFVPLPGGDTAVYTSSGLAYYRHTDHLGSSRFASTPTQTRYADLAYSPFGEPYAQSGAIDPSFTGQNQDTTAGLYDFLFREQDPNQARWTSPDPAGISAVVPANPQTWNRYAYVANMPLDEIDPLGLCPGQRGCQPRNSGPLCEDPAARANGGCTSLPPGACDWGGPLCGGWGGWYDSLQAIENQVPNPDWWTTGCIEAFDCGNIPAFLDVYTLVGPLFPVSSNGGTIAQPRSGGFNPNKVNSCVAKGLKETGLSIGLDVVGAIPGLGNMLSAGAGTARAINDVVAYGGGAAGIATSVSDQTPFGTLSASGGVGLALADLSLGGTKAIPLVGNVLSGTTGIYDIFRFNEVVQACTAAP
ncbi:MAG: RHS repeat-associated core domain-containing protein [Candidatus Acidiferrum sp.]